MKTLFNSFRLIIMLLILNISSFAQFEMKTKGTGEDDYQNQGSNKHKLTDVASRSCCAIWNDPNADVPNPKLDLTRNFTLEFNARFSWEYNDPGADGIVFVMQNVANNIIEGMGIGARLGYIGSIYYNCDPYQLGGYSGRISPSVSVEFDTFDNSERQVSQICSTGEPKSQVIYNDQGYDHVSIVLDGLPDISNDEVVPIFTDDYGDAINVENGQNYCIRIDYRMVSTDEKNLSVTITDKDDVTKYRTSRNIASWVNNLNNTDNGEVFWGFIGASHAQTNTQEVQILTQSQYLGIETCYFGFRIKEVDGKTIDEEFYGVCEESEYSICNGGSVKIEVFVPGGDPPVSLKWSKKRLSDQVAVPLDAFDDSYEVEFNDIYESMDISCSATFSNDCTMKKNFHVNANLFKLSLKEPTDNSISCDGEINRIYDFSNNEYIIESKSCCSWIEIGSFIEGVEDHVYPGDNDTYIDWQWDATSNGVNVEPLETIANEPWKRRYAIQGSDELVITVTATYHYLLENGESHTCTKVIKLRLRQKYEIEFTAVGLLCDKVFPTLGIERIWWGEFELNLNSTEISYLWQGPSYDGTGPNSDDRDFDDPGMKTDKSPVVKTEGTYKLFVYYKECKLEFDLEVEMTDYYVEIQQTQKMCGGCPGVLTVITKDITNGSDEIIPPSTLNYEWELDGNPTTLPALSVQNEFEVTQTGDYEVTVTMENGCTASATFTVVSEDFGWEVSGEDLCNWTEGGVESVTWTVDSDVDCNGVPLVFFWEDVASGASLGSNVSSMTFTEPGEYKVTVKTQNDCMLGEKIFEVKDVVLEAEAWATISCFEGDNPKLFVEPDDINLYDYEWTEMPGNIIPSGLSSSTISNPEYIGSLVDLPKSYKVKVKLKAPPNCETTATVVVEPGKNILFEAHDQYAVCYGESVQLRIYLEENGAEVTNYNAYDFIWSPTTGLDDPYSAEPYASPQSTTTYTVTMFTDDGCEYSKGNIKVEVIKSEEEFLNRIEYEFENNCNLPRLPFLVHKTSDCGYIVAGADYYAYCTANMGTWVPSEHYLNFDKDGKYIGYSAFSEDGSTLLDQLEVTSIANVFSQPSVFHNKIKVNDGFIVAGSYNKSLSNYNLKLMRFDNIGELQQIKGFGTNKDDHSVKIIATLDQGFLLVGSTNISTSLDIIAMKLSSNLTVQWAKKYGSSKSDAISDVVEYFDGSSSSYFIVGSSEGFATTVKERTLVFRINSSGDVIWAKLFEPYSSNFENRARSIVYDYNNSHFVVAGITKSFGNGNRYNGQLIFFNPDGTDYSSKRIDEPTESKDVYLKNIALDSLKRLSCTIYTADLDNKNNKIINAKFRHNGDFIVDYCKSFELESCNENESAYTTLLPSHILNGWEGTVALTGYICQNTLGKHDSYFSYMSQLSRDYTDLDESICFIDNSLTTPSYTVESIDIANMSCVAYSYDEKFYDMNSVLFTPHVTNVCSRPVCYCDEEIISVDIKQSSDYDENDNKCCYTISFTALPGLSESCDIQQAHIFGEGIERSFSLPGFSEVMISDDYTFCIDFFEGKKTIIIEYLDAGGNVICGTTKDIHCKCDCEDFGNRWDKLELRYEATSPQPGKCCFDIFLTNQNVCAFRESGFIVTIPESMNIEISELIAGDDWSWAHSGGDQYSLTLQVGKQIPGNPNEAIWYKIATICGEKSASTNYVTFAIDDEDCNYEWRYNLQCKECCEKVKADIISTPQFYDTDECCYQIKVTVEEEPDCGGAAQVIMTDLSGTPLSPPITIDNNPGIKLINLCVAKSSFKGQPSMPILVSVFNSSNEEICANSGVIEACPDEGPTPCTPDYPDEEWIEGAGFITVQCPGSQTPCGVKFNYVYRHIIIGGISEHRDLQILNYTLNGDCSCSDEILEGMLLYIMSDPDVMNKFEIKDDENWAVGETRCYSNFRVITVDCWSGWEVIWLDDGTSVIKHKKCEDVACCYAGYTVCYRKDDDKIAFESATKTYGFANSQGCVPPCQPDFCGLLPDDVESDGGSIQFGKYPHIDNDSISTETPCFVDIFYGKSQTDISINIDCEVKGEVFIQMSDILGNVIFQKTQTKNNYSLNVPLERDLQTGYYFVRVIINNELFYYKKIAIMR